MLNKALADAHRKGTVVRNVAALADAPSLRARRRAEIMPCDADQLAVFLDGIAAHPLYAAFHLAAHSGKRRREVLGLRWGDVDLEVGRLSVRQALVSVAYQVELSDVKTGYEGRPLMCDPAGWYQLPRRRRSA